MDSITRAELWLYITTLVYFLMNGAQVFETLVLVPKWADSPPGSLRILLAPGASLKYFWIVFHSLHEITFILAIVFCWKIEFARNWLLVSFAVHFAVRAWTLAYFAPNIIHFQQIAETGAASPDLISRVSRWQMLNFVRVAIFIAVSIGLAALCIRVFQLRH